MFAVNVIPYLLTSLYNLINHQGGPYDFQMRGEFRKCWSNWWAILFLVNNFLDADTEMVPNSNSSKMSHFLPSSVSVRFEHVVRRGGHSTVPLHSGPDGDCLEVSKLAVQIAGTLFDRWYFDYSHPVVSERLGFLFTSWTEVCNANSRYWTGIKLIFRSLATINRGVRLKTAEIIYMSFYSNISTAVIGIILGYVVEKQKTVKIESQALFYGLFLGLPSVVIYFTFHTYSRLVSAVLAVLLRPLFATGIAIGIYGMNGHLGGVLKDFLGAKVFVYLGSISYSTYLVNYSVITGRMNLTGTKLLVMSDYLFVRV